MTGHTTERIPLGTFPTPLEPAPRLAAAVGLREDRLWLKRDDLTGLGGGGNKVRKLERTLAAALRDGADCLVTTGAAQSNHARLTAAAGARLGLAVTLVLAGHPGPPGAAPQGNLLLDELFGARIRWAGDADDARLAAVADEAAAELASSGAHPAVIPFGGSNRDGALAYADAARELAAQLPEGLPGQPTSVVSVGSGGTMAGLVAELGPGHVLGVHAGAVATPADAVAALASTVTAERLDPHTLRLRTDQVGVGYASLTEPAAAAIRLAARTEGIVLDPTYTGRALAGLIAAVRDGDLDPAAPVVFWHTGGLPGLFGHPEIQKLLSRTVPGASYRPTDSRPAGRRLSKYSALKRRLRTAAGGDDPHPPEHPAGGTEIAVCPQLKNGKLGAPLSIKVPDETTRAIVADLYDNRQNEILLPASYYTDVISFSRGHLTWSRIPVPANDLTVANMNDNKYADLLVETDQEASPRSGPGAPRISSACGGRSPSRTRI
jgi:D-cysteine desulfhydrase